jgi:hypothetical protein
VAQQGSFEFFSQIGVVKPESSKEENNDLSWRVVWDV